MLTNDQVFHRAAAVTPADGTDLGFTANGLVATTAGNASVITANGDTVTIPVTTVPIYIAVTRVRSTGTTATGIVALA